MHLHLAGTVPVGRLGSVEGSGAQGPADEDFGRALGGDAILAAQTALYEELVDFFLKRGRPDRAKAVAAQKKMIEMAIERVKIKLESMNPEAELDRILGNSSTS